MSSFLVGDRTLRIAARLRQLLPVGLTPGEVFDRYTILLLKTERVSDPMRRSRAATEAWTLQELIYGESREKYLGLLDPLVQQLKACNAELWQVEDRLRELDSQVFPLDVGPGPATLDAEGDPELVEEVREYLNLARSVYRLNDKRSRLKAEINETCGFAPEVKQYTEYEA